MRPIQVFVRYAIVATTTAAIAAVVVTPAGAGVGSSGRATQPARAVVGTHYAVTRDACAAPALGHVSCLAMRRVPVAKGTPGAQPYVVKASYPVGQAGGYTPADLASAYGFNRTASGSGQTVAVVDAFNDPNALADLDHFDEHYALGDETSSTFEVVGQTGLTTALPTNDTTGWSIEESLDVDAVRGVCQHCKIILVETNSTSDADLAAGVHAAVALGATEVSNSYGGDEAAGSEAAEAAAYNYPGVVVTASTGDHGWYTWDYANENFSSADLAQVPSSVPTVVSVGGTSLDLNANGTRSDEHVWNHDGLVDSLGWSQQFAEGATGGGCSTVYAAPGWQLHVPGYAATGCGTSRLNADVSAIADPYTGYDIYDSFNGGEGVPLWATYGGTSLASPVIAAMWALAGGSHGVAYPAMSLYGHLVAPASPFYDVKVGGNGYCGGASTAACSTGPLTADPNNDGFHDVDCSYQPYPSTDPTVVTNNRQCNAAVGYDGPSGVGTPNGLTGFTAMSPTARIIRPARLALDKKATFSAAGTDPFPGGSIASQSWQWGDGSPDSNGASAKHAYTHAGRYTVRVTVTDNYGRSTLATTKVRVGIKPVAKVKAPKSLRVGKKGTFRANRSRDADTGGRIAKYTWVWGDGSARSHGVKATHAFAESGTYVVTLRVRDNTGLTASKKVKVKVKK
jgi:PKD domain